MDILNKELKEKHKMLGENNVEFIKNINDIENIFDIQSLNDKQPIIKTENDVIIFFDTPIFNSNYFLDLILEYLGKYDKISFSEISSMLNFNNKNLTKEIEFVNEIKLKLNSQTKKTKIYYCQDEDVYVKLFDKFLSNKIKTDKQVPIMLTIKGNIQKGKQKDIFIDFENIAPISLNTIIKNMILLYDYNQLNFLKN